MSDVAERVALIQSLQEELARQKHQIEELQLAVRARDEFLSIAAHELRNPMTPLLGQVEVLLAVARRPGSSFPEPIVAGLQRLEQAIDRYLERATTLLDVSRITSGKLRVQRRPVDLSELIFNCVSKQLPAFEKAGCFVEQHLQSSITAHLDPLAVEQIADNLLSNAAKYGVGAPVEVTLSCDEATARLSVRDHGIGISAEDKARIFDRFERTVMARSHSGGFGVGLWITCQLVQALDGKITVESQPGEGATFEVTLPRRLAETSEPTE